MSTGLPSCYAEVVAVGSRVRRVAVLDVGVLSRVESAELVVGRAVMGIHAAVQVTEMHAVFHQGVRGAPGARALAVGVAAASTAHAALAATLRARRAHGAQAQVCVVGEATIWAAPGGEAQA